MATDDDFALGIRRAGRGRRDEGHTGPDGDRHRANSHIPIRLIGTRALRLVQTASVALVGGANVRRGLQSTQADVKQAVFHLEAPSSCRDNRCDELCFGTLWFSVSALVIGAPSITASALSRDTSPSDRRLHFVRSVFLFTYQESFLLPDQGSHLKSCGGTLVPPAIYSIFDHRP